MVVRDRGLAGLSKKVHFTVEFSRELLAKDHLFAAKGHLQKRKGHLFTAKGDLFRQLGHEHEFLDKELFDLENKLVVFTLKRARLCRFACKELS